jgi:DNA polymerase III subunit epsilon
MDPDRLLLLKRPLVIFDTETTGAVPYRDRIIEIAAVRLNPDGSRERWSRRVNPEMRIPVEATAIHGITNADVENCPPFRKVADEMIRWIGDADLCGFNVHSFDLRILKAELARCGVEFPMEGRRVIDVQVIFHSREPRDLSAAVRFYLGRDHRGAHGAEADAEATLDVLLAQLERYTDLDRTAPGLEAASSRPSSRWVDPDRKLEWRDGQACLTFGKYAGRSLQEVMKLDLLYVDWILERDFPDALKAIIAEAKSGRFPQQETAQPDPAA